MPFVGPIAGWHDRPLVRVPPMILHSLYMGFQAVPSRSVAGVSFILHLGFLPFAFPFWSWKCIIWCSYGATSCILQIVKVTALCWCSCAPGSARRWNATGYLSTKPWSRGCPMKLQPATESAMATGARFSNCQVHLLSCACFFAGKLTRYQVPSWARSLLLHCGWQM